MMKLRKNLLIGLLAGLLAFAGVACNGDDDPADPGTDPGITDDPADVEDDPGLEEDPLDS